MLIFFDSEFTDLHWQAKLISAGLVAEDGQTFYAELSDTYQVADCGDFAREVVLPLLDGGESRMTLPALSLRLGNWIEGMDRPVTLATDSLAYDWPWIQDLFAEPGTWPANLAGQPLLLTMNDLLDYDRFETAVEQAFAAGLRRHHALDDARANRLGWIAAGGDTERDARMMEQLSTSTARASAALDGALRFVERSNKRIAEMECKTDEAGQETKPCEKN